MLKYDSFYFQCPHCQAWLEGRNLKAEMVNQAILYSDGKVLNDNLITTPQKMIMCPSCGHIFWVEKPEEPFITYEKPDTEVYSWNTWRFYGISFSDNKGKMALVNHYKTFLRKSHYEPKKEIYLRRFLWWAYNDLHRNHQHVRLRYWLNGFMSFGVWHCNRKMILEGEKLFIKNYKDFTSNFCWNYKKNIPRSKSTLSCPKFTVSCVSSTRRKSCLSRWAVALISPTRCYVIPSGKILGCLW